MASRGSSRNGSLYDLYNDYPVSDTTSYLSQMEDSISVLEKRADEEEEDGNEIESKPLLARTQSEYVGRKEGVTDPELGLPIRRESSATPSNFKRMKSIFKRMKTIPKSRISEERETLIEEDELTIVPSKDSTATVSTELNTDALLADLRDREANEAALDPVFNEKSFLQSPYSNTYSEGLEKKNYQVSFTIIEGRLTGPSIDPVVSVQVGDLRQFTTAKYQTHTPEWNEYGVFDMNIAPLLFFDLLITIKVYHARKVLNPTEVFGTFTVDVATVFAQAGHMFLRKWAVLVDQDDILAGPKGYLKINLVVSSADEITKPPPTPDNDDDEDNIEANLLLPAGNYGAIRQYAKYAVKVYSGDGLPSNPPGILDSVKRALSSSEGPMETSIDTFIQVSFAGHTAQTSTKPSLGEALWNEELVFVETFPPLVRRIRVQVYQKHALGTSLVATHFLDLSSISDKGPKGFLPTMGPTYVYLYGSESSSIMDVSSSLNQGVGEGVTFKGRLLIALSVNVLNDSSKVASGAHMERTRVLQKTDLAPEKEFLLFGCIFDLNMLSQKLDKKAVHLEVTMGNEGWAESGAGSRGGSRRSDSPEEMTGSQWEVLFGRSNTWKNSTPKIKAVLNAKKTYSQVPFGDSKPCIGVFGDWPDLRWRLYHVNYLRRITKNLAKDLDQVEIMEKTDEEGANRKFHGVIDMFMMETEKYLSYIGPRAMVNRGSNALDKERWKMCRRIVEKIADSARKVKSASKNCLERRVGICRKFVKQLQDLAVEPQDSFPDIIIWLVQGRKRIAYHRIRAQDIIHSSNFNERGELCSKLHSFYMKLPGRLSPGESLWRLQGQVTGCFWLGPSSHRRGIIQGIPMGYKITSDIQNIENSKLSNLPPFLEFTERSLFHLRCHIYQGKFLIASDNTGLSDPFARILFGGHSATTKVIHQTLNPIWDESLEISGVVFHGISEDVINKGPPNVVVELFDEDMIGANDFIGQVLVKPTVKLLSEAYAKPKFPPSLQWYPVYRGSESAGEILGAFELFQITEPAVIPMGVPPLDKLRKMNGGTVTCIPDGIRPELTRCRMEVFFWGLRDLSRVGISSVASPRIELECGFRDKILQSEVISSYKKNPNFQKCVKGIDLEMPEVKDFWPSIEIRCLDSRSFGRDLLIGTHHINALDALVDVDSLPTEDSGYSDDVDQEPDPAGSVSAIESKYGVKLNRSQSTQSFWKVNHIDGAPVKLDLADLTQSAPAEICGAGPILDWWSKYFASVEDSLRKSLEESTDKRNSAAANTVDAASTEDSVLEENVLKRAQMQRESVRKQRKASQKQFRLRKKMSPIEPMQMPRLKIYETELEKVPDFEGFQDWISTFDLMRGKETSRLSAQEERRVGKFKCGYAKSSVYRDRGSGPELQGKIKICRYRADGTLAECPRAGLFGNIPNNDPVQVLVRVYVVKATNLHPADLDGRADPYLTLTLGNNRISDRENYISKQLHPVFGKCFEMTALFPQESVLTIQVKDWDLVKSDDLIGETSIDLENRFYSRHRAHCGLPTKYELNNFNAWRDAQKPSQILEKLCAKYKLGTPSYSAGQIKVGSKHLIPPQEGKEAKRRLAQVDKENLALFALRNWDKVPLVGVPLVPEHVETRSLYSSSNPGMVMGKLEMWVDMFTLDCTPAPVDISPRKPKSYELRVIIWNTEDVVLEDDNFFTGEKMSDIYVKGWVQTKDESQSTDIHYRSLTGEGNFNWRFIFPFEYLEAEEKMVFSKKESIFSVDKTETKTAPVLELQVWDADYVLADDFLGSISLNLTQFPRGSKTPEQCGLDLLDEDKDVPTVNLFQQKRVKGWWPFVSYQANGAKDLTGKVEVELQLLSGEEAEASPAGPGRSPPDPLVDPSRPDASFVWFMNPLKSVRFIVWKNHKGAIIKGILLILFILLFILFIYSVPGYIAKRMVGA